MPNPENLSPRRKGDPPLPGAGRPKGSLNTRTILAQFFKQKEEIDNPLTGKKQKLNQLQIITLKQLQKARQGDLASFNALLDRYEGKPEQKQINEFPEGTEINVNVGKPKLPGQDNQTPLPPPPAGEASYRGFTDEPTEDPE